MKIAPFGALLLLGGCVYYNGVYNAKRLTRSAERAESEGRTIEATDYWNQVVVKADSVVARHPASAYVPVVQLLRGRALARTGQCAAAVTALEQSLPLARDSAAIAAGTFDLARCQAALGNLAAAAEAFGRLRGTRDAALRREARFQHGRALRLAGRYDLALDALDGDTDPRAVSERMVALGGAGRLPDALVLADSAIARADTAAPWDSLLSAAGRHDPLAVSRFVDRLIAMPASTTEMRARWLLSDGVRLMAVDSARGNARLAQAATVGGAGESAGLARLARVRLALDRVRTAAGLGPVVDSLGTLRDVAGAQLEAAALYDAAVRVRAAADSAGGKTPQADLALFLAAEIARDALGTPALAEALFQRLADEWPRSAYAPKALLALHQLNPELAPDFQSMLQQRYPESPYVAAIRGEDVPQLRVLEDSLGAFAATMVPGGVIRPAAEGGQRGAPTPGTKRPVEPQ